MTYLNLHRSQRQLRSIKIFAAGEQMVKCERCRGFMVRDSIYNLEGQFLEIEVGRCLNCGNTVDLTFLKINQKRKAYVQSKKERALA